MAYSLKTVLKGSSIYTAGQFLTNLSGFLLIPVYTRYLSTEEYGIIGILEVFLSLMVVVLMFGTHPSQTRFYYDYKDDSKKVGELLFSINCFLVVMVASACFLLTFFGQPIFSMFIRSNDVTFNPFIVIIIWTTFFSVLNQLVVKFYVTTKKYTYSAVLQFLQFLINASLILLFVVYFKEGALGKIKGVLIAEGIFCLFFYWPYAKNFAFKFDLKYVKYTLVFGMPLVFHLISGALLHSIDRVILEKYVPLSQVGIYTLGYQIGMVMSVLVISINKAWTPNYYDLMQQDNKDHAYEIRKAFYLWLAGIGTICLIGSLWAKEILVILTPENFHAASTIAPLILFSYFIYGVYFFVVGPIFYYKKTKTLPLITGSAALLNIGFNFLLIPQIGIFGAAYATLISFLYMATVVYLIGKRLFDPQFDILKIIILISVVSIPCFWLELQEISLQNEIFKIFILTGFVLGCYVLFHSYLHPIFKYLPSVIYEKAKK
jgi:O-antigen/teichoic acid export membrane protein